MNEIALRAADPMPDEVQYLEDRMCGFNAGAADAQALHAGIARAIPGMA